MTDVQRDIGEHSEAIRTLKVGEDLGVDAPTWSGSQGQFVQNIATGTADVSNNILVGWRNTTGSATWLAQHMSAVSPAT